jgi:hypothetical protein
MKWVNALKWAIPVWGAVCVCVVAINCMAEPGQGASSFNLALTLVAAYPLTAFLIKETGDDWAAWRRNFGSPEDERDGP